jgi:hypothetical protein
MLFWLWLGCSSPDAPAPTDEATDASDVTWPVDSPDADPVALPEAPGTTWTIAVWMAADNDLELAVPGDFEELERAARVSGYRIVVQVDRAEGHFAGQRDFTGTRRYVIAPDGDPGVRSRMVDDLGEVDMADPSALADFLAWADDVAPSDELGLVYWSHGGGAWIVQDDGSGGSTMSLADEVPLALGPTVARRGKLGFVAFDGCNMGGWETGVAMAPFAKAMVASEAWVNLGGYAYDEALHRAGPGASPLELADALAWSAGVANAELSHAAHDLDRMSTLVEAIDELAGVFLADPEGRMRSFYRARHQAPVMDRTWGPYYLDLGGFFDGLLDDEDPEVAAAAAAARAALDDVVLGSYGRLTFASGLSTFAWLDNRHWISKYADSAAGRATRWDELLTAASDHR